MEGWIWRAGARVLAEKLGLESSTWKAGSEKLGMDSWAQKAAPGKLSLDSWAWRPVSGELGSESWGHLGDQILDVDRRLALAPATAAAENQGVKV